MKRLLSYVLLASAILVSCTTSQTNAHAQTLHVFAAASLTDAFTEVGRAFEASHAGVKVIFNFGGSQNLRTQIEQGASADVFASANTKEMDTLVTESFVSKDAPKVFLTNQLIVILPKSNPANIHALQDLSKPGVKLVLAAEEVPAGKYARQVLDQLSVRFDAEYKDKVLANVVSNEDNVRQAVAKVQLGEADASIVYASDAVAAHDLQTLEIPADVNVIAKYPIAPPIETANTELADEFIAYVLSAEGQAILKKWGFTPAAP